MKNYHEPILNQSIQTLDFSDELKGVTEILGMHSLADVLRHHTCDIIKLPGFSVHLIHEYVSFLEDKGLGDYVDPIT